MKVDIEIERSITIALPPEKVRPLFDDIEAAVARFPKLKKLSKVAKDQYVWELSTIGSRMAKIAHDVTYGAHYQRSADGSELSWKPLPNKGNASIAGAFRVLEHKGGSEISFKVKGELRDVPVPLIYRLVAPPFIQGKFIHLVETFLERTRDALLEQKAAAPAKKKAAR
jgi:carbon monoxide dehydrogenase subunit G